MESEDEARKRIDERMVEINKELLREGRLPPPGIVEALRTGLGGLVFLGFWPALIASVAAGAIWLGSDGSTANANVSRSRTQWAIESAGYTCPGLACLRELHAAPTGGNIYLAYCAAKLGGSAEPGLQYRVALGERSGPVTPLEPAMITDLANTASCHMSSALKNEVVSTSLIGFVLAMAFAFMGVVFTTNIQNERMAIRQAEFERRGERDQAR